MPAHEIALIYSKDLHGRKLAKELNHQGIDHLLMNSKERKQEYDPRQPRVTVVSASSSKGLEFQSVVVGAGFLGSLAETVGSDTRLMYVAMTRALGLSEEPDALRRDTADEVDLGEGGVGEETFVSAGGLTDEVDNGFGMCQGLHVG